MSITETINNIGNQVFNRKSIRSTVGTAAKKAKDFARADEIRNQLTARGVIIIDTPTGPTWKRG